MKACGEVDVQIHVFLTSALAGGQFNAPAAELEGLSEMHVGLHVKFSLLVRY
jgi:hypothetical protein